MRPIVVALSLILVGCIDDTQLFRVCPQECYTGSAASLGVGTCRAGIPTCDDDGNVVACEGEVLRRDERCNGLDDNCNGLIDEGLAMEPFSSRNDCSQNGLCGGTEKVCRLGEFICDYPQGYPAEEICNALDDDCDGRIDEGVEQTEEFCYTGPPGTALVGECLPGYPTCTFGDEDCSDVVPTQEICDGLDNDCDGFVDNVTVTYAGVDIVLGIDVSGSMSDVHSAVEQVVCEYAQAAQAEGGEETYRFAVLFIAEPNDYWSLAQDLVPADVLCGFMQSVQLGSGGTEPAMEAARAVLNPNNPLNLSWRRDSKRIFVGFTDEPAQVRHASCPGTTESAKAACIADVIRTSTDYCEETGSAVYWFVRDAEHYINQARNCLGDIFWLTTDHYFMLENMGSILGSVCLEGESTRIVR